jgi:hypothetical protein
MSELKIYHSSGFFSCCTIRLRSIIYYYEKTKKLPIVNSSKQWIDYKDFDEDVTNFFFLNNEVFDDSIEISDFSESGGDQFNDYSKINYDYVNFFIEKYFTPSKDVLNIKNNIIKKYNIDIKKTISICYRGNDKMNETKIPSYDDMLLKVNEIRLKYPNHRILIQSDEVEFCEFMLDNVENSFVIEDTKKIKKKTTNLIGNVQKSTPIGNRIITAQIFLAVMYLMSETSHIILNSGNVGLWICLLRGNSENISQYLGINSESLYKCYDFKCSFNGEHVFLNYTYGFFENQKKINISKPNSNNWF